MPRNPRVILKSYDLIEVSNRTVHSRFLLRPSPELRAIINGAIARAQRKYGVVVHGYVFLSNHYHLLISPTDALQMARFVAYLQSKIAKEVGRLYGWKDKVWCRRFHHIPISADESTQVARLRYLLENSCKEDLVSSPLAWPGASSAAALATGEMKVEGLWPDRTAECLARRKHTAQEATAFLHPETVHLTQLPCWRHLTPDSYRQRVGAIIQEIERTTKQRHRTNRTKPLGARRAQIIHPHRKPKVTSKSPKPLVHALTLRARRNYQNGLRAFVAAYRAAVRSLVQRQTPVRFPRGSFPPGLPFVPT